ncbi:hypothetical protein GGI24_005313 [Coemansia furcata]|nr:hypothetical protein GGI24_005313 [Coemansia furcata]
MLIYKDIISGDRLLSDEFTKGPVGITYEVECKMIPVEFADEDNAALVNNVIDSNYLQPITLDKNEYHDRVMKYIWTIDTRLRQAKAENTDPNSDLPKRVDSFQAGFSAFVKNVLDNFDNYELYTGSHMSSDGMVVLLSHRGDKKTPYLTFFRDGLVEEMD